MSPVYLAFSVLPCPHPPNPLPNGKGEIFCFLMQGASPLASPGLNPGDTGSTLRNRFFWCRRRTPVAVNKNSRKVLGGLGASFKKPPTFLQRLPYTSAGAKNPVQYLQGGGKVVYYRRNGTVSDREKRGRNHEHKGESAVRRLRQRRRRGGHTARLR